MTQSYIVISILVVCSVAIHNVQAGYTRLNNYLIDKVSTDEVGPNLEAAANWLKEQENSKLLFLSRAPIGDLKKFTALQQVVDDTKCDHEAYEILRANIDAADSVGNVRRVDKLILRVRKAHAVKCQSVYPISYLEKKQQLDATVSGSVKEIGDKIISWDLLDRRRGYTAAYPSNLFREYIAPDLAFRKSFIDIAFALRDALTKNSEEDPNAMYLRRVSDERSGKRLVHKDKIKELSRKYLIEPCKQYEAVMGPDLFEPARLDAEIHHVLNEENQDFYLGWSYYKFCKAITADESEVFDEAIKVVPKKSLLPMLE